VQRSTTTAASGETEGERPVDQPLGLGTRDEHPGPELEPEAAELDLAQEVLDRLVPRASGDERVERPARRLGHRRRPVV
jgi:hypothetical protein